MTIRSLRKQHAHAVYMARLTRSRGWQRAVSRLNLAIMQACRK